MFNLMYERLQKYAVDAKSIEDFCDKYHRRDAYHNRGADYMAYDLQAHISEYEKYGYTMIPPGSSTTGDIITYYGKRTV